VRGTQSKEMTAMHFVFTEHFDITFTHVITVLPP